MSGVRKIFWFKIFRTNTHIICPFWAGRAKPTWNLFGGETNWSPSKEQADQTFSGCKRDPKTFWEVNQVVVSKWRLIDIDSYFATTYEGEGRITENAWEQIKIEQIISGYLIIKLLNYKTSKSFTILKKVWSPRRYTYIYLRWDLRESLLIRQNRFSG